MLADRFRDRTHAGQKLAELLDHLRDERCVIFGLPRGGVPVAFEVARHLAAPLEVLLIRKLGAPSQPELAVGAIGEGGIKIVDQAKKAQLGISDQQFEKVEKREQSELDRQSQLFRGNRPRIDPRGHTAVIVDDGIATGSTALAACQVLRKAEAGQIVVAVPVAPRGWEKLFSEAADQCIAVLTPAHLWAIGFYYQDFNPTPDSEVISLLGVASQAET